MLGIPTDPELVTPDVPMPAAGVEAGSAGAAGVVLVPTPGASGGSGSAEGAGRDGRDGVSPTGGTGSSEPPAEGADPDAPLDDGVPPVVSAAAPPDAGLAGSADAGAPPGCTPAQRVPVDVIFAVDNSGSMAEEDAAFEGALPGFVARLASAGIDYRIILVSRHRQGERGSGSEANTSVCIASPVSGLAQCPGESPAPAERFFHYSIKLDAADSLARLVESLSAPDPFGLTASGWSEWLRPSARKHFIEITDADSELSASEFTSALSAASPEHFAGGASSFVFHAVLGVLASVEDGGVYDATQPVEVERCSGPGSSIDSAGPVYQELSRATGGVRLPICPPEALGSRLELLADDTIARGACPG